MNEATSLDKVTEKETTWLVPGIIPEFALTIIDGDPGQGKSFLTLELAAALSKGKTLGPKGRVRAPFKRVVLVANAEDDLQATIVPRLRHLEADLSIIHNLGESQGAERRETPYLPERIGFWERRIKETRAQVVIIDPIMAYLSPYIKANSDQAVRVALGVLRQACDQLGVTVVMVRHLNKSGGAKALYRGGGSIGIIGITRSGLYVGPNPEDPHEKILCQLKSNLGPLTPPWAFEMVKQQDDVGKEFRKFRWLGVRQIPLDKLLSIREADLPIDACESWLKRLFKDRDLVSAVDIDALSKKAGLHMRTLKRAKANLEMGSIKKGGKFYWTRPGYEKDPLTAIQDRIKETMP